MNLITHNVKNCPNHANEDVILKRINELKSFNKQFSIKSETDDAYRAALIFRNAPRHMN